MVYDGIRYYDRRSVQERPNIVRYLKSVGDGDAVNSNQYTSLTHKTFPTQKAPDRVVVQSTPQSYTPTQQELPSRWEKSQSSKHRQAATNTKPATLVTSPCPSSAGVASTGLATSDHVPTWACRPHALHQLGLQRRVVSADHVPPWGNQNGNI